MLKKTIKIFIILLSSFNIIYSNENLKLFYAVLNENLDEVKKAIQNGTEVDARDPFLNRTSLMLISYKGNKIIAEFLVSKGANVNAKNSEGWTALMWACNNGHKEIVDLLILKGADINAKNNEGWTALMWACDKGYTEIIKLLITKCVNIKAKNNKNLTALSIAEKKGYKEIVELLIKFGIDK